MPVFNAADTIQRSIESVLSQTCAAFELLVLDDGSTDETAEIVSKCSDSRIKYLHLTHRGLAATLNSGIKAASGSLIARQDADDWSAPCRLEKQRAVFDRDPTLDLVASWWAVADAAGTLVGLNKLPESDGELRYLLNRYNPICHGSVLIKKQALAAIGGYDENLLFAQDYDLWLRMAKAGMRFHSVQESLYTYVITPESVARGWQKLAFGDALRDRGSQGSAAGELKIGTLPRLSERRIQSIYDYTIGSLQLDLGNRRTAGRYLAKSLKTDPRNWRALLKLGVTPLPGSLSRYVLRAYRSTATWFSSRRVDRK